MRFFNLKKGQHLENRAAHPPPPRIPLLHLRDPFVYLAIMINCFKQWKAHKSRLTDCVMQKTNLPQVWFLRKYSMTQDIQLSWLR